MHRQNKTLLAAFATTLSERRREAGLTQEELAERADTSARYISFLETGRRQPTLSALHALSNGLGVSMQELVADIERTHRTLSTGKDI